MKIIPIILVLGKFFCLPMRTAMAITWITKKKANLVIIIFLHTSFLISGVGSHRKKAHIVADFC